MIKKMLIGIAVVAVVLISLFLLSSTKQTQKSDDLFIQGNLTVSVHEVKLIKNGGKMRVTGDLTIDGTLACEDGKSDAQGLSIEVGGTFTANGKITCLLGSTNEGDNLLGTSFVLRAKNIMFAKTAEVTTNGNIDIAHDSSSLLTTESQKDFVQDSWTDSGDGARVGPFVYKNPTRSIVKFKEMKSKSDDTPHAVIQGTWNLAGGISESNTHGRYADMHPFFRIHMGEVGIVTLKGMTLLGRDGRNGAGTAGIDCSPVGSPGGDGLLFSVFAGTISADTLNLKLGDGGSGGDVETKKDCKDAVATGGQGGRPGNMKWTARDAISLSGILIEAGKGGRGGDAKAFGLIGKNGCPGEAGGDAVSRAGMGGESGFALPSVGNVQGIEKLRVTRALGGDGGNASAYPGDGGVGRECGCSGGRGGKGEASPGDGGSASVLLFQQTSEAHGGVAGKGTVLGGKGADGGSCVALTKGGDGGEGGSAQVIEGTGGRGSTANGRDGTTENMTGGAGGNGGDGCPFGAGGKGGLGAPIGTGGRGGKSLCTESAVILPKDDTVPMIQAILYRGLYLPKNQLTISRISGCGEPHWRASRGTVTATNDTVVSDSVISACGFGKVSQTPIVNTPMHVANIGTSTTPKN